VRLMGMIFVLGALTSCVTSQDQSNKPAAENQASGRGSGKTSSSREDSGRPSGSSSSTSDNSDSGSYSSDRGNSKSDGTQERNNQKLIEAITNQRESDIYRAATQVLLDSPTDLRALNAMALYQYKKGLFLAAEYLLRKAAEAHPSSSEVRSNLGLVFMAQSKSHESLLEFRKALELNPNDPVASANLGAIYVENQDYGKALVVLDTVYRKGWKDPKALVNYAIALTAARKFDRAEDIYKGLLKDQNSSKNILFNYATLQITHLNKFGEGLETLNRLKFVGFPEGTRGRVSALEARAKKGGK
jgi:Flp pilus assembly protein TadD